ncbi:P-aminobenzoate N-oxygenase AurF [compost metagenome]
MAVHLLDEGRHSTFWARLTRMFWQSAAPADRQCIAEILPVFLEQYLTNDLQKAFDLALIEHLSVTPAVRQALGEEVLAMAYPIGKQHPLLVNILRFFRSSSMLDSPCVQNALAHYLPQARSLS